jgi:hypothetical protein
MTGAFFQARSGSHALATSGMHAVVPPAGAVHPDEVGYEVLARCAELLAACVTQTRLYGPRHPEAVRTIEALHTTLSGFLTGYGSTEWTAAPDGFWVGSRQITIEKEDRPGLANYLHVEGLASLRFDPGVTREELIRLLLIMRINLSLPAFEEETLESILFQAEFEHIGFEAVNQLMDAEALSGRREELDATDLLERLLVHQPEGRQDLASAFGDRASNGGRVDGTSDALDQADWDSELAKTADDDLRQLQPETAQLDLERDADHVAYLGALWLRAAVAQDPYLPATLALQFANQAVQQLYALGDATCLMRFIDDGHALLPAIDAAYPGAGAHVQELLRSSVAPLRIARMMRAMRMDDSRDMSVFGRLVTRLAPEVLVVFLDGLATDTSTSDARSLVEMLWALAGDRLLAMLETPNTPAESVVTLLSSASLARVRLAPALRSSLLRNRSALVRTAILGFYRDDLPAEDVADTAALMADRVATVRKAALDVLSRHRPRAAVATLNSLVERPEFADLQVAIKTDICVALARVAGPNAVDALSALLNIRSGLIADPRDASTMEAAARGLVATRSTVAMEILDKGVRGWSGPRRNACIQALQEGRASGDIA